MDLKNKAFFVKSDGVYEEIIPGNKESFSLEELQKYVGGSIEIVYGGPREPDIICVINEEGKLKDLQYNFVATLLFSDSLMEGDAIVGNVVICDTKLVK